MFSKWGPISDSIYHNFWCDLCSARLAARREHLALWISRYCRCFVCSFVITLVIVVVLLAHDTFSKLVGLGKQTNRNRIKRKTSSICFWAMRTRACTAWTTCLASSLMAYISSESIRTAQQLPRILSRTGQNQNVDSALCFVVVVGVVLFDMFGCFHLESSVYEAHARTHTHTTTPNKRTIGVTDRRQRHQIEPTEREKQKSAWRTHQTFFIHAPSQSINKTVVSFHTI